jgi:hypothetical protein
LRLDGYNEPQPDFMLLRPRADDYRGGHPNAAAWRLDRRRGALRRTADPPRPWSGPSRGLGRGRPRKTRRGLCSG